MDQECGSPGLDRMGEKDGGMGNGMEAECQGPDFDDEKMVNGMEDADENAYYDISEQDGSTDSIASPLSSDIKLNKRLRSKVWDDFIPTFVHGKVARAECKHCYQVFNCSSSYGTSNLLKHQVKCTAAGTQKKPRLQEHSSLPSTQKSTAAAGANPKQKKLPFLPSRHSKCLDTADAMLAQELVFPDTCMEKNRMNQGVDQNQSHEEVAALEQKTVASAPAAILNDNNKSYRELPEQNPTDTMHLNQDDNWNRCPEELIRIFAMHGLLPRMMEQDRFRKLIAWLNPMVKIPPYDDLSGKTYVVFRQEESKLKEKLSALRSRLCLSAYLCHYNEGLAFLCLTVHYIDDEWEKQQKIITFCPVDPSCSAKELSNIIFRAIEKWGIEGKVFSIILDDAFIDDSVASDVKDRLQKWNKLPANRSFFVVRYATYLLDQVMQVGLDELEKFREKSAKCSKSTVGPSPSVFQYPNCRYAPSREDWITAQKICNLLGHFHIDMDMESTHNNPGPVDFYHKLWNVKRKIRSEADFYDQAGFAYMDKGFSDVLYKMQQKFKECWKRCFFHFCMPMVMDPKYCLKHIKICMHLYDWASYLNLVTEMDNYIHYVHDTLLSLFYEYSYPAEDINNISRSKTSNETFVRGNVLEQYYHNTEYPYGERPLTELDQYLQEPDLATSESSALQWWKEHSLTYPTIARMARDILSVPCKTDSKVAIRSARIAMSLSVNKHLIEKQVCIQDWLKPAGTTTVEATDDL